MGIFSFASDNVEVERYFWEPVHQVKLLLKDSLPILSAGIIKGNPDKKIVVGPVNTHETDFTNKAYVVRNCLFES